MSAIACRRGNAISGGALKLILQSKPLHGGLPKMAPDCRLAGKTIAIMQVADCCCHAVVGACPTKADSSYQKQQLLIVPNVWSGGGGGEVQQV